MIEKFRVVWRTNWTIGLILFAFIGLGITYSLVTPLFEAPDERGHYFYVKHLADGHGLPVLLLSEVEPYWQEGGQPPLYYLMGALLTFWIDTSDARELRAANPYANVGIPLAYGNKNVILHSPGEAFPYQGAILAVHLVRLLSVLLGATTVLFTYLLVLEIYPEGRALALGAAAINAFIPQFLFISGSVNNDNLVTALSSLSLFLLFRLIRLGPTWRRYALLGLVLGLACLSKLSALGLLGLTFMGLLIVSRRQRSASSLVKGGLVILIMVGLLAGWWYLRNWLLYGNATALNMYLALIERRARPLTLSRFFYEMRGFKTSFWALFGWFNVLADSALYVFYDLLSLAGLLGFLWGVIRGVWHRERFPWASWALLFSWLAIMACGLYLWTAQTPASQGRLIFPGLPAISLFLFWGLSQLVPRVRVGLLARVVGGLLFTSAAVSPFLYIAPAYSSPPLLSPRDLASVPSPLEIAYEGQMRLLGYEIGRSTVRPGEYLPVSLYWQSIAPMEENYTIYVKVFGPGGGVVGQVDTYPGLGSFPTIFWKPGDAIRDTYMVFIEEPLQAPAAGYIEVGLYERSTMRALDAQSLQGEAMSRVILGRVKIASWRPQEHVIPHTLDYKLGNMVSLVGYGMETTQVEAGGTIHLTLYWQAQGEIEADYTVFTHLVDSQGRIWAQKDNQPAGGNYPTSLWDEGEVVKDEYELTLDPQIPPGDYWLEVGMYLLSTGERLHVFDSQGELRGDRVILGQVEIGVGNEGSAQR